MIINLKKPNETLKAIMVFGTRTMLRKAHNEALLT